MIYRIYLAVLIIGGLSLVAHAQGKEKVVAVQIRAVFHDPINPKVDLFYTNKEGAIVPLTFRPKALSKSMLILPVNGSLSLYNKAEVDPKNPGANLAVSVKLPANIKKAILVVVRERSSKKAEYKMLLLEDSVKAFPKGESRVLSLINTKTAIQAGEHKLIVHPRKITVVPPVKKVNEFNMAQTNFYYPKKGALQAFTERQLQYLDNCRRLFILHKTPGASVPKVTTIVDLRLR